eukprot:1390574-Prymnesium_polylepis.1
MLWECGIVLAMALEQARASYVAMAMRGATGGATGGVPVRWDGLRVLELGSGTGVAGLAAAAL